MTKVLRYTEHEGRRFGSPVAESVFSGGGQERKRRCVEIAGLLNGTQALQINP